jgi:probable F420-dependent oxidoreductase
MRIGVGLPQAGPAAGPDAIVSVAKGAEQLGYDSLWVLDRILWPVNPRAPYPVGDGSLPEPYKRVLDPVGTLMFAAAHTSRLALGTSIMNLPWYNPVLLARELSTLDILSNGRLRLGFGTGWSPDEYEAVNSPFAERGKRADEALQVLKAIWTTDPVEFNGKYYKIPLSYIGTKPVQKPHPPIYMAAYVPAALKRVATETNGWMPAGIPLSATSQMFDGIKQMAAQAGRDPEKLELIVRGNMAITNSPIEKDRADFTGTLDQIGEDIAASRKIGAAELILEAQFSPEAKTVSGMLNLMEKLIRLAK